MPGSAIGFDRRINMEWLDAVAGQVVVGVSKEDVRRYLWKLLEGVVAGDKVNCARGKTITVLMHVWQQVPSVACPLQQRALRVLSDIPPEQRLAVHWAMVLGTYPFAVDVASVLGRILALQGSISLSLLSKRLVDLWGERSTLLRAAQRLVRSMVQWGVLKDSGIRGVYELAGARRPVGEEVALLLLEAVLLYAQANVLPLDQAVNHPALFPFKIALGPYHLRRAHQFRIYRQGLDSDVISLAQPPDHLEALGAAHVS